MSSVFEMILTALVVAIVLAATYYFSNRLSQSRVAQNFEQPAEILTAVDVYVRYGKTKAAIDMLEGGLERYPDNEQLRAKLEELQRGV